MATPTKPKGTAATRKVMGGVKELWNIARKDFAENSRELKQDFVGMIEAARVKMPSGSPKDPKIPVSLLVHNSVNVDAGGELLSKYKEEWGTIHSRTEEASRASGSLNATLSDMHRSIQYSHAIITDCCTEFKQLPEVVGAIETTRERVQELGQLLGKVEQGIVEYARVQAELEAARRRESLKIQHDKRRGKMERELQRLREELGEERTLKEGAEREMEAVKAAERQQTFQDIFQQQMADYRETGSIDRAIGTPTASLDSVPLEDVTIEDTDGTASLNEFLSDVDDVIPDEESHDTDNEETEVSHDPGSRSHDDITEGESQSEK